MAVPGVAGPPEPPMKLVDAVNNAGDVKAQLGVELTLNEQTVLLSVCSVSAFEAPPLAPIYTR